MNTNSRLMTRAHLVGLSTLVAGAMFAVGTFGYTMVRTTAGEGLFALDVPPLAQVADVELIVGTEVDSLVFRSSPLRSQTRAKEEAVVENGESLIAGISSSDPDIIVLQIDPPSATEPTSVGRSAIGTDEKPKPETSSEAPADTGVAEVPAEFANDREAVETAAETGVEAGVEAQSLADAVLSTDTTNEASAAALGVQSPSVGTSENQEPVAAPAGPGPEPSSSSQIQGVNPQPQVQGEADAITVNRNDRGERQGNGRSRGGRGERGESNRERRGGR